MVKKILKIFYILFVGFLKFFVALMFVLCAMYAFMAVQDPTVLDFLD